MSASRPPWGSGRIARGWVNDNQPVSCTNLAGLIDCTGPSKLNSALHLGANVKMYIAGRMFLRFEAHYYHLKAISGLGSPIRVAVSLGYTIGGRS